MKILENTFFHTAIVGGGAAGLFCAGSFPAAKIVLEANETPARKVRVSGGGKCNFANRLVTAQDYQSNNCHFCKSALAAFGPDDFVRLLEQARIPFEERPDGRLFAQDAEDIVRFLIHRARQQNTQIACGVQVLQIVPKDGSFTLYTSAGTLQARHVVLASGGLSYPSLGANSSGWQLAKRLGLNLVEPAPALCGLQLPKEERTRFAALAGNSLTAKVRCGKHIFHDRLLFTHEGFSGPAVLQISLFWEPGQPVEIDFLPEKSITTILQQHKTQNRPLSSVLKPYFPGKIARVLLEGNDVSIANASRAQLEQAVRQIHRFTWIPPRTAGYTKAEVTRGGVDTRELHAATLQARKIPGLYVIGELADVTGRMGGFNLQWAWSSAFAAAADLAKKF